LRKQYHFRPSKNGLYAWDVHRLVKLSKNIEPKYVSLSLIGELNENYWFGGEGEGENGNRNSPTCMAIAEHCKLISETDLQYPIILSSNGRVMDGMHRVCKERVNNNLSNLACFFVPD